MGQPLSKVDSYYKVDADARPSNYLINHVSWGAVNETLNWTQMVLVRNISGFPVNPDDGVTIFTETSDSVVLQVTGVDSAGAINTTPTVLYFAGQGNITTQKKFYPVSTTFTGLTGEASVNVNTEAVGKGTGATFNLAMNASATITISAYTGGSGYVVGDLIRISGDKVGSRKTQTSLGITNKYHVFDTGATTATSVFGTTAATSTGNPGYGVTGTSVTVNTDGKSTHQANEPTKYYYSVFVKTSTKASDWKDTNRAYNSTRFYWKKLVDVACPVVKDKGTVTTLLNHLPDFYKKKYGGQENTDLKAFLSLFAFHLDGYIASADSIFNLTEIDSVDDTALTEWLKQFGRSTEDVVSIAQLRKLIKNIIPMYERNGSLEGLQNVIETYAGWNALVESPKNLLPSYNSSSFLESLDSWYAVPTSTDSYATTTPYLSKATLYTSKSETFDSYPSYIADPAYNETPTTFYNVKATVTDTSSYPVTSATANATTITYTSTAHPFLVGQHVIIDNMRPNYYNTYGVITTKAANTFGIANYNGSVTNPPLAWAASTQAGNVATANNGVVLKVNDTSNIKQGMRPDVISSTSGTFAADTYVTAVLDATTIKLNNITSGKFVSGDTIKFSDNLNSNLMRVGTETTVAATVSYYMGPKKVKVSTAATASNSITVRPGGVAEVGDYVIDPVNGSIPAGTYVSSINSTTSTLVLRDKDKNKSVLTLASGTELWFSKKYTDKSGAITAAIAVLPSTPYAFGLRINRAAEDPKVVNTHIDWYDKSGNAITVASPNVGTIATSVQSTYTWNRVAVTEASPANAMYAVPRFEVVGMVATNAYYIDSATFVPPVKITSASFDATTGTATLTTDKPHNFTTNSTSFASTVTVSGVSGIPAYAVVYNGTFNITGTSQNLNKKEYSFTYTTTGSAGETSIPVVDGYAASHPIPFEDARKTKLKILANRVNLVPNPSFETGTSGWSGGATVTPTYPFVNTTAIRPNVLTAGSGVSYTSTTAPILVTPGKAYSFSAYGSLAVTGDSRSVYMQVEWVDSTNAIISTATSTTFSLSANDLSVYTPSTGQEWTKIYMDNLVAPVEAYRVNLKVLYTSTASAGFYFYLDGVKVEQSEQSGRYFDGNFDGFSYGAERDTLWESLSGESRSHLYTNKVIGTALIDRAATNGMYYA